jgi:hypothetical protein
VAGIASINGHVQDSNGQALNGQPHAPEVGRNGAPGSNGRGAQTVGRPTAKARHAMWAHEHDVEGKSYGQIAKEHKVTRRAVLKAIQKIREESEALAR